MKKKPEKLIPVQLLSSFQPELALPVFDGDAAAYAQDALVREVLVMGAMHSLGLVRTVVPRLPGWGVMVCYGPNLFGMLWADDLFAPTWARWELLPDDTRPEATIHYTVAQMVVEWMTLRFTPVISAALASEAEDLDEVEAIIRHLQTDFSNGPWSESDCYYGPFRYLSRDPDDEECLDVAALLRFMDKSEVFFTEWGVSERPPCWVQAQLSKEIDPTELKTPEDVTLAGLTACGHG